VPKKDREITFIDLFAGIGGFHIAFERAGAKCVFVSEWDAHARNTYRHNFSKTSPELFEENANGETPTFAGDITEVSLEAGQTPIKNFDILCGGFPCQPFSQAGLRKGLDETRGTLFFNILDILTHKSPDAYFLENVRGLENHMSGETRTLDIIKEKLMSLGYSFNYDLVKASDFGVPQHRPRLFMYGFKNAKSSEAFVKPEPIELELTMSDILGGEVPQKIGRTLRVGGVGSGINDRRNWDSYLVNGVETRITVKDALRMQGFPDWFEFPETVSRTQAMKQLGNSVAVPAIEAYAKAIITALKKG
jgi:DNA (cytosine-5)-methyltransferase 1